MGRAFRAGLLTAAVIILAGCPGASNSPKVIVPDGRVALDSDRYAKLYETASIVNLNNLLSEINIFLHGDQRGGQNDSWDDMAQSLDKFYLVIEADGKIDDTERELLVEWMAIDGEQQLSVLKDEDGSFEAKALLMPVRESFDVFLNPVDFEAAMVSDWMALEHMVNLSRHDHRLMPRGGPHSYLYSRYSRAYDAAKEAGDMAPFGTLVGSDVARMSGLLETESELGRNLIYTVLRELDETYSSDNYHPYYFWIPLVGTTAADVPVSGTMSDPLGSVQDGPLIGDTNTPFSDYLGDDSDGED